MLKRFFVFTSPPSHSKPLESWDRRRYRTGDSTAFADDRASAANAIHLKAGNDGVAAQFAVRHDVKAIANLDPVDEGMARVRFGRGS
jgi:hypothetical protein